MRPTENPAPIHIAQMPGPAFVIPDNEIPDDLPYSQWEDYSQRQILAANGFADDAGIRQATHADIDALREAAYCVLAKAPQASDEPLLRAGLRDRDPSARLFAARALVGLGDAAMRSVFDGEVNNSPTFGNYAPLIAARFLGELKDATAFAAIDKALATFPERHVVIMNALPFAALHGQPFAAGKTIDIWQLYARALDGDEQAQNVALAQLDELANPASAKILTSFIGRSPSPPLREKAERLLKRLH